MSKNNSPPTWVSQNFLTGAKIIRRLLRKTSINSQDHIIEIGPGKGHITGVLLRRCKKVSAIEIDKSLYHRLHAKFETAGNLKLYHLDFLKWQLPAHGTYKVFANIPFCHTTDIVRKLAESINPPAEAWLTMEKGAAKRLMGIPRENALSLILKPLFDMRVMYHFAREDFHPMPGVDVVMVHLKRKELRDIPLPQWRSYRRFVATATKNNCAGLARIFSKKQLSRACREAGLSDLVSGEILYIQWLCLFRCYCLIKKHPSSG